MVVAAAHLMIVFIQVIIGHRHIVKCPEPAPRVVVELLAHKDVVEALALLLIDMGVVDIADGSVFLQCLRGIKRVIAAACAERRKKTRLFGQHVERV